MPKPNQNETSVWQIVQAVRELFEGRSHAVGQASLRASQTTTTVSSPNIGESARISLTPRTANAASELGAGTAYVSSVTNGSFVITHASGLSADRTFDWHALG